MTALWLKGHLFWMTGGPEPQAYFGLLLFPGPDDVGLDLDIDPAGLIPYPDTPEAGFPDFGAPAVRLLMGEMRFYYRALIGFTDHPLSPMPRIPRTYRGALPDEDRLIYPAARSNECWLELEHRGAGEVVIAHDVALFTVAPVIFSSDCDTPTRLLVAALEDYMSEGKKVAGNFGFVGELAQVATTAGIAYTLLKAADIQHGHVADTDLWCRDAVWFGHVVMREETRQAMVHTPRPDPWLSVSGAQFQPDPDTASFPQMWQAARDNKIQPTTMDSGGNLVVSPPVLGATDADAGAGGPAVPAHPIAPYGKLIIGDDGQQYRPLPELRAFLDEQRVQPLVPIDTSFLRVGHADEVVSFATSSTGRTAMFIASPDTAITLLTDLYRHVAKDDPDPVERAIRRKGQPWPPPLTFDLRVGELLTAFHFSDDKLSPEHHPFVTKIAAIEARLRALLRVDAQNIAVIPVPVLFDPEPVRTHAMLPNMVNLLPLGDHLIVPKPWGPRVAPAKIGHDVPARLRTEYHWKRPHETVGDVETGIGAAAVDVTAANDGRPEGWAALPYRWAAVPDDWRKLRFTHETVDLFEAYMVRQCTPLGFTVHFVDDWDYYHFSTGEVHCGTNATRAPRAVAPEHEWWNLYEAAVDVPAYAGCR